MTAAAAARVRLLDSAGTTITEVGAGCDLETLSLLLTAAEAARCATAQLLDAKGQVMATIPVRPA